MFELDQPCLHSSTPYSRNVHVRVTERVDEHWGLKESDVGWYLLDVVGIVESSIVLLLSYRSLFSGLYLIPSPTQLNPNPN